MSGKRLQHALRMLVALAADIYQVRRKLATGAVVALTGLIAYHAAFGDNGMVIYREKRAEHRRMEQEIQSLQLENQRLQERIHALRTDPKTIEKEAREQLHYVKPGEVVYTVPEASPAAPAATAKK